MSNYDGIRDYETRLAAKMKEIRQKKQQEQQEREEKIIEEAAIRRLKHQDTQERVEKSLKVYASNKRIAWCAYLVISDSACRRESRPLALEKIKEALYVIYRRGNVGHYIEKVRSIKGYANTLWNPKTQTGTHPELYRAFEEWHQSLQEVEKVEDPHEKMERCEISFNPMRFNRMRDDTFEDDEM
jgi:hypothetical protein